MQMEVYEVMQPYNAAMASAVFSKKTSWPQAFSISSRHQNRTMNNKPAKNFLLQLRFADLDGEQQHSIARSVIKL